MQSFINIGLFIFFLFLVILIIQKLMKSRIKSSIEDGNEELHASEETIESIDYNKAFIDSLNNNDNVIRFLKLYNHIDLVFIQSLLFSSKIMSFVEYSHMSSIYPMIPIKGYNDMFLDIKETDYEEAKQIITEYLSNDENNKKYNAGTKILNAIELLVGGTVIVDFKDRFKPTILT